MKVYSAKNECGRLKMVSSFMGPGAFNHARRRTNLNREEMYTDHGIVTAARTFVIFMFGGYLVGWHT